WLSSERFGVCIHRRRNCQRRHSFFLSGAEKHLSANDGDPIKKKLSFDRLVAALEAALRGPLPGPAGHARMAPRPRREWPADFNPARIRNAAGLLLVFPVADRAHIVLTVRADMLERHSGQVSLPGGVIEPGETFEQTALREAHEEIALPLEGV